MRVHTAVFLRPLCVQPQQILSTVDDRVQCLSPRVQQYKWTFFRVLTAAVKQCLLYYTSKCGFVARHSGGIRCPLGHLLSGSMSAPLVAMLCSSQNSRATQCIVTGLFWLLTCIGKGATCVPH